MEKFELIEVGDEVGVIFSDSMLKHLNVKEGDMLQLIEENGAILI